MRDLAYDEECSKIRVSTPLALGRPSIIRYTMLCIGCNRKSGISMFDAARSRDLTSGKLHVNRSPQIYDVESCVRREGTSQRALRALQMRVLDGER